MSSTEITKDIISFTAQRVILTSSKPFKDVVAALDQELNKAGAGMEIVKLLHGAKSRQDLEEGVQNMSEGTRDFVYFSSGAHSKWLSAYFDDTRSFPETHYYILGNPLIAQTILKHDIIAGLHIPPKILVQEMEGGAGSRIIYELPSSVMAVGGSEVLKKAAEVLDVKLENMARKVLSQTRL
ncbi:unnamed protein product [Somion occarium]|uniref:DUF302 domain-containing protein n=1 Tax=Somion occarium TaxID=3059160 RepID=A0ABP1DQJ4_9APHY